MVCKSHSFLDPDNCCQTNKDGENVSVSLFSFYFFIKFRNSRHPEFIYSDTFTPAEPYCMGPRCGIPEYG